MTNLVLRGRLLEALVKKYPDLHLVVPTFAEELGALIALKDSDGDEREAMLSFVLQRYDLVTNYRAGSSIEELEKSADGEWVRFEDVVAIL